MIHLPTPTQYLCSWSFFQPQCQKSPLCLPNVPTRNVKSARTSTSFIFAIGINKVHLHFVYDEDEISFDMIPKIHHFLLIYMMLKVLKGMMEKNVNLKKLCFLWLINCIPTSTCWLLYIHYCQHICTLYAHKTHFISVLVFLAFLLIKIMHFHKIDFDLFKLSATWLHHKSFTIHGTNLSALILTIIHVTYFKPWS